MTVDTAGDNCWARQGRGIYIRSSDFHHVALFTDECEHTDRADSTRPPNFLAARSKGHQPSSMSTDGHFSYHGGHYTSRQNLLLGVTSVGLAVSTLAVSLRLFARRYLHVKLWWDDYLAVLTLVRMYISRKGKLQPARRDGQTDRRTGGCADENVIRSCNIFH